MERISKFIAIILILSWPMNLYAADKEMTLRILERNKKALEVNKRIVESQDDDVQWIFAVNEYGILVVYPTTQLAIEQYNRVYSTQETIMYLEEKHPERVLEFVGREPKCLQKNDLDECIAWEELDV